jgi:hypothetical protein
VRSCGHGAPIARHSQQALGLAAVCLLDLAAHKTGASFTKPVDPIRGQAIEAWHAIRPSQPRFTDRWTGERVDLLFAFGAHRFSGA